MPPQRKTKRKVPKLKTYHAFHFVIFICGMLLPPLAVALRFGIGADFFLNVFLTICGYFPSHFHNFYLQNIRNNKNKNRAPKWALKYGLVQDYTKEIKRERAWANRYDERLPGNDYDDPDRPTDDWESEVVDPINPTNPAKYIPAKIKDFSKGRVEHDYEADFAARPDLDPYVDADHDAFATQPSDRHAAAAKTRKPLDPYLDADADDFADVRDTNRHDYSQRSNPSSVNHTLFDRRNRQDLSSSSKRKKATFAETEVERHSTSADSRRQRNASEEREIDPDTLEHTF